MNRMLLIIIMMAIIAGCSDKNTAKRIPLARAGDATLYLDQIENLVQPGTPSTDSSAIIQNYINKWAHREFLLQKAEENLAPELKEEIDNQVEEARANLVIYQYQQQMMLERMDTLLSDAELENYYSANSESFLLSSNIIKALFIKLPLETPDLEKIKVLSRSNEQIDIQQLETYCYQFAEKFDDFKEGWIPFNRVSLELPQDVGIEENFLKRNTFYETRDSTYIYLVTIRDFRLRSSLAPFEYVRDDIKRIIWNTRRFDFIQSLENGIYNDAIRENNFTIYNK
jgi:hypothetical protein